MLDLSAVLADLCVALDDHFDERQWYFDPAMGKCDVRLLYNDVPPVQ